MQKQLSEIKTLVETQQISQARTKLEEYLKNNPEDSQGWFLASFTQPTPKMRLLAIQRAAKLKPDQQDIQKRLAKLVSGAGKKQISPWLLALTIGIAVLLTVVASAVILPNLTTSSVAQELPTLAVLQVATGISSQEIAAPENGEKTIPTTVVPVLQTQTINPEASDAVSSPQPTEAVQTGLVPSEVATQALIAPKTPGAQAPAFSSQQPNNPLPLPTAFPSPTSEALIAPTAAPDNPIVPSLTLAPTQSTVMPPTIMPTPMQIVPLDTAINIGTGQFRVVDATRGAESLIQSLGGSFSAAPANQSWLLVELLLVCADSTTCKFDSSTLKIIGASGVTYASSPQLNLTPAFGTITQNHQIWGYLGFIIPSSETSLELALSENGQTYAVALG
jgi:hypothetical protein